MEIASILSRIHSLHENVPFDLEFLDLENIRYFIKTTPRIKIQCAISPFHLSADERRL